MTGPDPRVAAVRTAVRSTLREVAPDGGLVLVACSGGADSLALAAATAFVAPRHGARAGAVVVDHGWDSSSAAVAHRTAAACRDLGLDPVEVAAVDSTPAGEGPEAAARTARYRALDTAADRHGAATVLLGHTLDDQAETVLLGLARGSGARSLAGMPGARGRFRRPLLGLRRHDVRATCDLLGLDPVDDPSNADPAFARARVRAAVLPVLEAELGPGVAEALAATADLLRADADLLDALAEQALAEVLLDEESRVDGGTSLALDTEALAARPDALRRRVLRLAALRAGTAAGALGRRHLLAVDALVTRWRGQGAVHLPGRAVASRSCGRLTVTGDPVTQRTTHPAQE